MRVAQGAVQDAYDRLADVYDEVFCKRTLGEAMRADVWQIADHAFGSARRLLDLGAGTGEDAIHFARRGIHVTAVDNASRMIDRLRAKAIACGVSSQIDSVVAEMNRYIPAGGNFDSLISNFSAINCVDELKWLRETAERGLIPGSRLVLTGMGAFYPLETVVFIMKGQLRRAFLRFKDPCEGTIEGIHVRMYHHSPRAIGRVLGPHFKLERLVGLRAWLPVASLEHLQRLPIFRLMTPIDRAWCSWRVTSTCADHFVSVWRYQPNPATTRLEEPEVYATEP